MHARILVLLLGVAALLATACASAGPWVELAGERYRVEVADADAERARGLMFRDELPAGRGCPPYPSRAPALYVLELNAGEARRLGLEDGTELRLGPGIAAGPAR